jgi:hypothetical protein
MSVNQSNQGDAKLKNLQAREKERDLEGRDRNLTIIQMCFVSMVIISFCFIFEIFTALGAILQLTAWDSAPTAVNMFFGMLLIGLPVIGVICTRQVK